MNESKELNATTPASAVEPYINKAKIAERLNCGLRTVDTWMGRGILPFYKISKRVVFRWSEVQVALEHSCRVNRGGWKL
jgi:hypothetical protein